MMCGSFLARWRQTRRFFSSSARSDRDVPRRRLTPRLEGLEGRVTPTLVNLTPVADNTLYEVASSDPAVQLSNGAGEHFYVGDTGQAFNNKRRGALRFDLSAIPAGSTINSVTLTLAMTRSNSGAQDIIVHRALAGWGEGTSNAAGGPPGSGGGDGTAATAGDATWYFSTFSSQSWAAPGGDFTAGASATTSVGTLGQYQWTGAGLIADVQQWLTNPSTNFGWILTGNETAAATSKQFDTRESLIPANRPVLTVDYSPRPPTAAVTINDGAAQRSMVTRLTVTFSTVVTIDPGAFTLQQVGGGAVALSPSNSVVNGKTVVVLTFTGTGIVGGSLADGSYVLTVSASKVRDQQGTALDGNGDGTAGDDFTLADNGQPRGLFRLYGDGDGNRVVNQSDLALFRVAFGSSDLTFDVDGNGAVNQLDLIAFRANFGKAL
jgi:hypothetical protein